MFAIVTGALLACVLALAWRPVDRWQSERRAAAALSSLCRCLLGSSLPAPDAAERRLRAVIIAASLDPKHGSWPRRCAPWAEALRGAAALVERALAGNCGDAECCMADARCASVRALREETARSLELIEDGRDRTFDPVMLLRVGTELGWIDAAPERTVPEAPPPVPLLDPNRMRPLFEGDYLRLLTDPADDREIDLLFYEHETRYGSCKLDLSADGAAAVCRTLAESIPVGLAGELLGGEPGAPLRLYAQGPEGEIGWVQAIYDVADGRRLSSLAQRPSGGFVYEDGSFVHIGLAPPMADLALYRVGGSEEHAPRALELPTEPSSGPRLLWDEIVWTEPLAEGRHRVLSRRVLRSAAAFGPVVRLGDTEPLGELQPQLEICKSDRSLTLLVAGSLEGGMRGMLALRTADGWTKSHAVTASSSRFGLTCRGDSATLSWTLGDREIESAREGSDGDDDTRPVTGRYAVHRLRCTPHGCKHDKVLVPLERFAKDSRYVAGDLGDSTVILWRSAIGDVRMRVAPLEHLPFAPDTPLFDDLEHDGFDWDLERDPIFGRADSVLVLISRQVGTSALSSTYGVRVDARGRVVPVDVATGTM